MSDTWYWLRGAPDIRVGVGAEGRAWLLLGPRLWGPYRDLVALLAAWGFRREELVPERSRARREG